MDCVLEVYKDKDISLESRFVDLENTGECHLVYRVSHTICILTAGRVTTIQARMSKKENSETEKQRKSVHYCWLAIPPS